MKFPKIEMSETIIANNRDALIAASRRFDADWYVSKYSDVKTLGMDPLEHFLKIGEALGRSPGPDFDTKFYRDTYSIWHQSGSPLADFLSAKEFYPRPTTKVMLQRQLAETTCLMADRWGATSKRKVSYCIPVMDRLDDIKGTLAQNLEANSRYHDEIEFLVIEFGKSNEVAEWMLADPTFQHSFEEGLLRFVSDQETLDTWHFGRAKNAFRGHLRGQIYSSLDADNFVTADETAWLIAVAEEHPLGFIAHHFSGDFGDGTCGRISMPSSLYRAVGYDPHMLPRQWDDLGLMAATMKHFPAVPLVVAGDGRNIMNNAFSFQGFVLSEQMPNRILKRNYPKRKLPLNPTGADYLKKDRTLLQLELFNSALARCQLTTSTARQKTYMEQAQLAGRHLLDCTSAKKLVEMVFEESEQLQQVEADKLCLFASARDEAEFLPGFLDHYRALGVDQFYFVDDGSKVPISDLDLGPDVIAVRPKVGDFKTSKGLWLGVLSKFVLTERAWMLTVDVDELVHVPNPFVGFRDLIVHLELQGADFVPGLLIEMLPHDPSMHIDESDDPFAAFDSFCWNTDEVDETYRSETTVSWGFGEYAELSWRVDARYHAFGTVDSLRKIPLLRRRSGWHLNEGFHTLFPLDNSVGRQPSSNIFDSSTILPVLHYKLSKLWSEDARQRMLDMVDSYDPKTSQQITSYFQTNGSIEKMMQLKDYLRPKKDALNGQLF